MEKGAVGMSRPNTVDAGDAPAPASTGMPRAATNVAPSFPKARALPALIMPSVDQSCSTKYTAAAAASSSSTASRYMTFRSYFFGDDETRSLRFGKGKGRAAATTSCFADEPSEVPTPPPTKKPKGNNNAACSVGEERVDLLSDLGAARSRALPDLPPMNLERQLLLLQQGASMCKIGDGDLPGATDAPISAGQKSGGWDRESKTKPGEEDGTLADDEFEFFVTIDRGSQGADEPESSSAGDEKLGSSAPRSPDLPPPLLSIGGVAGMPKGARDAGDSATLPRSSSMDLSTNSSSQLPARDTAEHTAWLMTSAKKELRGAVKEERRKRRKMLRAHQAADATREKARAASSAWVQLDDTTDASREQFVNPAAAALAELERALAEKSGELPRAQANVRAAVVDLMRAKAELLAATNKFDSARRTRDATWVTRSADSPLPDFDSLATARHNAEEALSIARGEANARQARVQSSIEAITAAYKVVRDQAAKQASLSCEIARAESEYQKVLAPHQKLESRLRAATRAKHAARTEAKGAQIDCAMPFREHAAAKRRLKRICEAFEHMVRLGRNQASGGGGGGGGGASGSGGEERAAGMKRGAPAPAGEEDEGEGDGVMMMMGGDLAAFELEEVFAEEEHGSKRRRH